ncbi:MAG TPA: DUF4258 domain-containing protein [Ignavibacteria bacterium]|nr:DUF4258 domain-containing protein [Ignavibacteria bacterium]
MIEILRRHGIYVDKNLIEDIVRDSEKPVQGYKNRLIAQKKINETHVMRVVYEELNNIIEIVTVYPGRINRYD